MPKNENTNLNGLQLSPMIWHDALSHGIEYSNIFAELLVPELSFKQWLKAGEIEFGSLDISTNNTNFISLDTDYVRALHNEYYARVGFIDKHGVKEIRPSIEELEKHHMYKDKQELFYIFKVPDLNHFVSLYFQHWLIFNTQYYWTRWHMYYDFIVKQSNKTFGGLYEYMWSSVFWRIDRYANCFADAEQYKQFRDRLDEITEQSKFVENDFIKLRDSKKER